MRVLSMIVVTLVLVLGALLPAAVRAGDAGSLPDESAMDPHYPAMAAWARAGVRGGIPGMPAAPARMLAPGDDLQAAIDALGDAGGWLRLGPGVYRLQRPLRLGDGVVVAGAGRDATQLVYAPDADQLVDTAVVMHGIRGAGLQGLSLSHAVVQDLDPAPWQDSGVLANDPARSVGPGGGMVDLRDSQDCWLSDCRIQASWSRPLRLRTSQHITLRGNQVWGALHRGSGGAGSYHLDGGSGILLLNEDLRDVRSLRLDGPLRQSVIADCQLGVGIILRESADISQVLFSGNLSLLPPGYHLPAIHYDLRPIGQGNLLLNHRSWFFGSSAVVPGVRPEPGQVYALHPAPQRGERPGQAYTGYAAYLRPDFLAPATRADVGLPAAVPDASTKEDDKAEPALAMDAPAGTVPAGLARAELVSEQPIAAWSVAAPLPTGVSVPAAPWPLLDQEAAPGVAWSAAQDLPVDRGLIDLLAVAGGWQRSVLLASSFAVQAPVRLRLRLGGTAVPQVKLAGQVVQDGQLLALAAGVYPVQVLVPVTRDTPFAKRLDLSVAFEVLPPVKPVESTPRVLPQPAAGRLYAVSGQRQSPLADAALMARLDALQEQLGAVPGPELVAELPVLRDAAADDLVAWWIGHALPRIEAVEAGTAAFDDELRQWYWRAARYTRAELPSLAFAVERHLKEAFPGRDNTWRPRPAGLRLLPGMRMIWLSEGRMTGWVPDDADELRGILYLNGDHNMEDWMEAARYWNYAIIRGTGVYMDGDVLDEGLVDTMADVAPHVAAQHRHRIQPRALLTAIENLARRTGHDEMRHVPIVSHGYSRFSGFVSKLPDYLPGRVLLYACGFGPGTGPEASARTPNIKIATEVEDLHDADRSRQKLSPVWRREPSPLRSLAMQWREIHATTNTVDFITAYIDTVQQQRVPADWQPSAGPPTLRDPDVAAGYLGSHARWQERDPQPGHQHALIAPVADYPQDPALASWLPDERMAWVWRAFNSRWPAVQITGPVQPFAAGAHHGLGRDLRAGAALRISFRSEHPRVQEVVVFSDTTELGRVREFSGGETALGNTSGAHGVLALPDGLPAGVQALMLRYHYLDDDGQAQVGWSRPAILVVHPAAD